MINTQKISHNENGMTLLIREKLFAITG